MEELKTGDVQLRRRRDQEGKQWAMITENPPPFSAYRTVKLRGSLLSLQFTRPSQLRTHLHIVPNQHLLMLPARAFLDSTPSLLHGRVPQQPVPLSLLLHWSRDNQFGAFRSSTSSPKTKSVPASGLHAEPGSQRLSQFNERVQLERTLGTTVSGSAAAPPAPEQRRQPRTHS